MSVLKRFRSESKMQFYATAQKLTRERRRLKTLYGLALCGKITVTDYKDLYHSWRSGWIRFDCHRSLVSLDKTYRRYLNDLQH